jgi:hypothetical protein
LINGLISQISRREVAPNIYELDCYLSALNKLCWGVVGGMVAGPKGAIIASKLAGIAKEILSEMLQPVFNWWYFRAVKEQLIKSYLMQLENTRRRNRKPMTFSEMFGFDFLKTVGFDSDVIEEYDGMADIEIAIRRAVRKALHHMEKEDDDYRKLFYPWGGGGGPPPPSSGICLVPPNLLEFAPNHPGKIEETPRGGSTSKYRLPSTASSSEKRGGVKMKAEIVKRKTTDFSEMFGIESSPKKKEIFQQKELICPFLLFSAWGKVK